MTAPQPSQTDAHAPQMRQVRHLLAALPKSALVPSPVTAEKLCQSVDYGRATVVVPGVQRIMADNAKDYTGPGTNTYLVGQKTVWVIDPGPACAQHFKAVMSAIGSRTVAGIFVTHTHQDHSPCARQLAAETGAPVFSGPVLPPSLIAESSEEIDPSYEPDEILVDGQDIGSGDFAVRAVHTPGHFPNHMAYFLPAQKLLFSGDHIMGWSTTSVVPPLGNLADYLNSMTRMEALGAMLMLPSHGPVITDPPARVAQIFAHRACRQAQIEACLSAGLSSPKEIVAAIYQGLTPVLLKAAEGQVRAHLALPAAQAEQLRQHLPAD